jgi:hypothetical protein
MYGLTDKRDITHTLGLLQQLFLWSLFYSLCVLHLLKNLGRNLAKMRDRSLVNLRQDGMGYLMDDAIRKAAHTSIVSRCDDNPLGVIAAHAIVNLALGLSGIAKANLPRFAVDRSCADFPE